MSKVKSAKEGETVCLTLQITPCTNTKRSTSKSRSTSKRRSTSKSRSTSKRRTTSKSRSTSKRRSTSRKNRTKTMAPDTENHDEMVSGQHMTKHTTKGSTTKPMKNKTYTVMPLAQSTAMREESKTSTARPKSTRRRSKSATTRTKSPRRRSKSATTRTKSSMKSAMKQESCGC